MKFLYISFFIIFFASCSKKDVKVPVNDNPGIHEIWDNSPVYILMKIKNKDTLADLKLGQVMTTTHWLVAADKRLKMNKMAGAIEKILKKRHKKSIHSKEGTHAYFSYLDSVQKKISFIDFDSIQLMPNFYTSATYLKEYSKFDEAFNKYHINISPKQIIFNDSIRFDKHIGKQKIFDSIWKIVGQHTNNKANKLYLNFGENIKFDRFLNYYTFFKHNPIPKGKLSQNIFIFKAK